MIIYNVTIKADKSIAEDWLQWLRSEHIPELMETGLFTDHRVCSLLEQDDTEGKTFAVQYFCKSLEDYNTYINEHAPAMRDKGYKRFGDKFVAFRTVMEIL